MHTQHIKHLVSMGSSAFRDSIFFHLVSQLICSYKNVHADEEQDEWKPNGLNRGSMVHKKIWSQFKHGARVFYIKYYAAMHVVWL